MGGMPAMGAPGMGMMRMSALDTSGMHQGQESESEGEGERASERARERERQDREPHGADDVRARGPAGPAGGGALRGLLRRRGGGLRAAALRGAQGGAARGARA